MTEILNPAMTRRQMLGYSLSVALVLAGCRLRKTAPEDFLQSLQQVFPDREAARRISVTLHGSDPDLDQAGDELYTLFMDEGPHKESLPDWLRTKHAQDLSDGKIFTFQNWVLSRTEVLLLASQV